MKKMLFVPLLLSAEFCRLHAAPPLQHKASDRIALVLEAKTYPLMHRLRQVSVLQKDPAWAALQRKREQAMVATHLCKASNCFTASFKISDEDAATAESALANAVEKSPVLRAEVAALFQKAHLYNMAGPGFSMDDLRAAWRADVAGINHTIDIYGDGAVPAYPKIDSLEFDPKGKDYLELLRNASEVIEESAADNDTFFTPSLRFALSLLRINDREDAARFEPMAEQMNAAAAQRVRTMNWASYPYSAILIPGIGPEKAGEALSPLGMLHVSHAVERYRQGKAPFIIVSGGSVHPNHTHFVEAEEMRRELMTRYGVPANAILLEPHARHTTTNLRNASRQVFAYHLPAAKPILIVANEHQIDSISSPKFADRNRKELHYLPWLTLRRDSVHEVEYVPSPESNRVDSQTPLEP